VIRSLTLAAALFIAPVASAVTVESVSPRGEVAQVRQITVRFSESVVPLGDLRLPDPVAVQCVGAAPAGTGRWIDDRTWVYDFREPVPPGVKCTLKVRPEWKPTAAAGKDATPQPLRGATEWSFSTGGPAIVSSQPWDGSQIEEDQHFLLTLTGPVDAATAAAHSWCEVEGIGERLPIVITTGPVRDALLKARRIDSKRAARMLLVSCPRPLPPDAAVRVVWGKGIAAAGSPQVVTTIEQRYSYRVRKPFSAEFSCERERANAACLPVRPMVVRFSAPVARKAAEQAELRGPTGAPRKPVFDKDDKSEQVSEVTFAAPLPENTSFTIHLPADLKDDTGRPLDNAAMFPLKVATGDSPPLAKFAAAPFGIVEANADSMLPVTLRHVQRDLATPATNAGGVRVKRVESDTDILSWYARVGRFHERTLTAREAGLPQAQWYTTEDAFDAKGRPIKRRIEREVETREVSLLKGATDVKRLDLPQLSGNDPRPFEVVGIPLATPGYYVVEIESPRLGAALLDPSAPMYVRTGVLVTNLGVHFKRGRESSVIWVTTLDRGKPVEGADVAVHDCRYRQIFSGRTDAQGLARINSPLPAQPRDCLVDDGYFVSARKPIASGPAQGSVDTSFVFSQWQKGIESWRFNLPTDFQPQPEVRAHTVFDRTLLRAGETVSMKHFARTETTQGLALIDSAELPARVKIVHQGTGQEFTQPLQWNGQRSATSTWAIPKAAKLGVYMVSLERDVPPGSAADRRMPRSMTSGEFRVEEFRVPLVDARVSGPKAVQVAPRELPLNVQLNYLAGGAMAGAPARVSALMRSRPLTFSGRDEFSFAPPRDVTKTGTRDETGDASDEGETGDAKLVADKLPVTTDANGAAIVTLKDLPKVARLSDLIAEVTFNDPNGEVQTASARIPIWPSATVVGIRAGAWASNRGQVKFTALALDTTGKAIKGQRIEVRGRLTQTISTRKRMVGGLYAYDNRSDVKELGELCSGTTDDRGIVLCDADLKIAGQVELIAQAKDGAGHVAEAATSVWVTKQGELWFAQDNDDRIDVLPEKKFYEPGETAKLQVRMPFREATALVSVEREGVIETKVVTLRGNDPTVDLKIDKAWGPNVYVSVLALRGRIRDVPWYSFFTWGWKEPLAWSRSFWYEGREYRAPTAMVDLAKPSFKLGVAAIKVGIAEHKLDVAVTADKPQYAIRQKAIVRIKVTQGGKPVAGTELAFAAVDEGLLALRNNGSWDLLNAMFQDRAWSVETSTAQGEIIGRRHYGRKAVPAGGGGGRGQVRELFDTLLLWKSQIVPDANGEAVIEVPLNDSLTSFRLVAVADEGAQRFGTGSATIRVTQDLQVLSGLPPLVRDGDQFSAMLTLRNTTAREMNVRVTLAGTASTSAGTTPVPIALSPQDIAIAAGGAKGAVWPVSVPAEAIGIAWEASAEEIATGPSSAADRMKVTQRVSSAVPIRVLQATLSQLEGTFAVPIAAPADALPETGIKRGGLRVGVQPRLSGALPGLRRYFETYPYSCLEQMTSKAIGLRDQKLWSALTNTLPTYLDRDGLANYFPPRAEDRASGSDRLTAYLLAASHESGFEIPAAPRDQMLAGLTAFAEGRIERRFWSPKPDLDVRKLAAIEALSRYGRAQPRMLGSVNLTPNVWPTAAVIDWVNILRRVEGIPEQAMRRDEAEQILKSRLTYAGTTMSFSTERDDFWWWLMDSADANSAKLILAVLDDPRWRSDMGRMVIGSLSRQRNGAWSTTTANLWGSLALEKFSAKFESAKITGTTTATVAPSNATVSVDWAKDANGGLMKVPWPEAPGTLSVAQTGTGKPWLTVQSLAAIPLKGPLSAGYAISRSVSAVEQKDKSKWSRGDVMRVRLEIDAQSDMTWVVVNDPVPGGATLLGSGLGRDSVIATSTEKRATTAWAAFEERSFEAYRSYYGYLPRGRHVIEYTLRLSNAGRFSLPPTRVEALYAPETFGEIPNPSLEVAP
jgi:uncharacterized protein YfaS (alpha-2-macroglobulin family)